MSDEEFFAWEKKKDRLDRNLQITDIEHLQIYFNIMYGENVFSNFQEQSFELHSPVDIQTIHKISHEFLWINEGQDELVQRIENFF